MARKTKTHYNYTKLNLWHYELLPYLPKHYFHQTSLVIRNAMEGLKKRTEEQKGELTHGILSDYDDLDFILYVKKYVAAYKARSRYYSRWTQQLLLDISDFDMTFWPDDAKIFVNWHTKEYLRVCMAKLYEKYVWPLGMSKVSDKEWKILADGYYKITGEKYKL
nr:MAG TPA: hypothetical protein [Caudoviricetes sp.]